MRVQNISNGYVNSTNQPNMQAPEFKQKLQDVVVHAAKGVDICALLESKAAQAWDSSLVIGGTKIFPGISFLLKEGTYTASRIFKGAYESLTDLGDRGMPTMRIMHSAINGRDLREFTTATDNLTTIELFVS